MLHYNMQSGVQGVKPNVDHLHQMGNLEIKRRNKTVVLDNLNSVYNLQYKTYTAVHANGNSRHSDLIVFHLHQSLFSDCNICKSRD